jgi:hypothetical protein
MSPTNRTAEESFVDVVQALGGRPGVTKPETAAASGGRFGPSALRVNGRIFAVDQALGLGTQALEFCGPPR